MEEVEGESMRAALITLLSLLLIAVAQAEVDELDKTISETPEAKTPTKSSGNVLDFEAEVIEGQRKAPQLFLQMQIETVNLDSVVYLRKNFNDFHSLEKDRKPVYRQPLR